MMHRAMVGIVAVVATVSLAAECHAHWWQQMGRSAGLGWSDGYHSRTGCPPRGGVPNYACAECQSIPAPRPLAQPQPTPQPTEAAPRFVPAGQSSSRAAPSWSVPTPVRR
jgi:hypothetical protein